MNIHLGSILAVSLILIGSCVSFGVLDRALRDTSKYRPDVCNSQVDNARNAVQSMIKSTKELYDCLLGVNGVGNTKKIAFHTMLTQDIALGESQTVIFDKVITNNGKGYNRHTGQFTATRDGTYYFTTSFLSAMGNVHLQMMKNAEVIGYSSGYPDNGSSGSISATVNLKKGDVVKVTHKKGYSTQRIHGEYSMFTGFIV